LVLFFASPLGGIFVAITNLLFALATNAKGDGLELCNSPSDMIGGNGLGGASSLFDALFGPPDFKDGMGGYDVVESQTTEVFTKKAVKVGPNKAKRPTTIIDVDVERY
jgi:hypothetical protein